MSRLLATVNCGGDSGLFFRIVSTRVSFVFSRSRISDMLLEKLSQVIFLPECSISLTKSLTTLAPWFTSLPTAGFFPLKTRVFHAEDGSASHIAQIFIPYFAGFKGIYCRNEHLSLQQINCSSTVYGNLECKHHANSNSIAQRHL